MSITVANGPFTRRSSAWLRWRRSARAVVLHVASIATLAMVLSVSGAFDSDDLPMPHRLALHSVAAFLLIVQTSLTYRLLRRALGGEGVRQWVAAVLAMALVLGLMTVELHWLKFTALLPQEIDPLPQFAMFLLPFVVPVAGLVVLLNEYGLAAGRFEHQQNDRLDELLEFTVRPMVAGLLPPPEGTELGGWPAQPIRRVRSVDHYLEIETENGSRFIRGRMQDATARLAATEGLQPHRSWWVALSEISMLERRGRDTVMILRDGTEIPVARGRITSIEAKLNAQNF